MTYISDAEPSANSVRIQGESFRNMNPIQSTRTRILVADDQPDIREALRLLLKGEGFETETVASPAAVLSSLEAREFDGLLMDLNYARDTTSGQEGLDLLSNIRAKDSTLPIIVMTAWGSLELAVEAMRRGAKDFVQKPWENARLLAILKTQIELSQALRKSQRLEAENRLLRADGRPTLIAESVAMRPVMDLISRVGPSDANVLITGEHGTGKEVIARTLYALSSRAGRPLVTVNAGGLPEGVFESELFGHVKGAFTDAKSDRVGRFELADGGTLFLDEIANVPMNLQAKLLRALETGELERVGSSTTRRVDVRILSATNADVQTEVTGGRFREDLLFRLEHDRTAPAAFARTAGGYSAARAPLPQAVGAAISQTAGRIRACGAASDARSSMARKYSRARPFCGARRAACPGLTSSRQRSGPSARARSFPAPR